MLHIPNLIPPHQQTSLHCVKVNGRNFFLILRDVLGLYYFWDLLRVHRPRLQISKGSQFVDQAHLVNRLNKFALQQEVVMTPEEVGTRSMRSAGSPPSPIHTTLPLASASSAAQLVAQAAAAQGIQNAHKFSGPHPEVALQAAFMRSQYEAAIVQSFQALAANQQRASAMTQSPQTADLNAVR